MVGNNIKVIGLTINTGTTAVTEYEMTGLFAVDRVEVQIEWSGITGTAYDGVINIYQRTESSMNYMLADSTAMTKTITTPSGNTLFSIWKWSAADLKLQIIKNSLSGGTINAAIGTRR